MDEPRLAWWWSVAAGLLAVGCDVGAYTVVVRFEPPELGADVRRVEVALVAACPSGGDGAAPVDPISTAVIRRGTTSGALPAIDPGAYGLYARGWSSECEVVAAGCVLVELDAGGEDELVVTLGPVLGPGCPAEATCRDGECEGLDAGDLDAGAVDGALPDDAAPPCTCPDCATCSADGSCVPDHDSCGASAWCDVTRGCIFGVACPDGSGCMDDGDACTAERCDDARDPPLCVADPAPDGVACTAGDGAGACRRGACCTGCWDGSTCVAGDEAAACGVAGETCVACASGDCRDGACCAGCWDGVMCRAGAEDGACGAMGGACAVCDASACPPTFCRGAACAPRGGSIIGIRGRNTCVIAPDGSLWGWGWNPTGALGLGDTMDRDRPERVGTASWVAVDSGGEHACGIQTDGSLWCWGENDDGELGIGMATGNRPSPQRAGTDTDWAQLEAGANYVCAVKAGGTLWCWGRGRRGQLGLGLTNQRSSPTQVGTDTDWAQVSARTNHTCATKTDGSLWCWGSNNAGELGFVTSLGSASTPQRVGTDRDWAHVSAGGTLGTLPVGFVYGFTCAIKTDGSLWCWGENAAGQLGLGGAMDRDTPTRVGADNDWTLVHTGAFHACAVKAGALYCWGDNTDGQLGLSGGARDVPTRVGTDMDWATVGAAYQHTCAIKTDDSIWCWGTDTDGELGDGPTTGSGATARRSCL
jgi:alpha-tubulin suppressor-like RCC1 family protein